MQQKTTITSLPSLKMKKSQERANFEKEETFRKDRLASGEKIKEFWESEIEDAATFKVFDSRRVCARLLL